MAMSKLVRPLIVVAGGPLSGQSTLAARLGRMLSQSRPLHRLANHPAFSREPAEYWSWLGRQLAPVPHSTRVVDGPLVFTGDAGRLVEMTKGLGRPLRVLWLVIDEGQAWERLRDDRVMGFMSRWDYFRQMVLPELQALKNEGYVSEVAANGTKAQVASWAMQAVRPSPLDRPPDS